jgi:glycogen operon protein
VFLNGDAIESRDVQGYRLRDDSFYLMLNAHAESIQFSLPPTASAERWLRVFDTTLSAFDPLPGQEMGREIAVAARSIILLRRL